MKMTENEIVIDPVTRVEGHGKISVQLDGNGDVSGARFHVTQFRGFEEFLQGRPFREMPSMTARICGICSISHGVASAKACDMILGVEISDTARRLRELVQAAEILQSHALHFFYLASPDLLLGLEEDPGVRNIIGVIEKHPELARMGISMRKFGQGIFERLSGARIHIDYPIPGGVSGSLRESDRDKLLVEVQPQIEAGISALEIARRYCEEGGPEIEDFARFDSKHLGLVDDRGNLEFYQGNLRMKSPGGSILEEVDSKDYASIIAEAVENWSYLKLPYYAKERYPGGLYRVGPLARLNVCDGISTEVAGEAAADFKDHSEGGMVQSTMFYHWARMIEAVYTLERIRDLLEDRDICGTDIVRNCGQEKRTGIGVTEAPRGVLIHHYETDENGMIEGVNLVVATGHNNLAMNRSVEEVARKYIRGGTVREGILNKLEAAIRCYDPCLSCSTHAIGQMPLVVEIFSEDGEKVGEVRP